MKPQSLVLVLDKSHSASLIMTKRLNSLGFRADTVTTAEGAVDYLSRAENLPDLILVNLNDEDERLIAFPHELKKTISWSKRVPFAVLSTIMDKPLMDRLLEGGYSDLLIRPIEHEIFKDRIEKLLLKSTGLSSATFKRSLREVGAASVPVEIREINEFGLKVMMDFSIPTDTQFVLASPTLKSVLEIDVHVRVVSCHPLVPSGFEIVLSYVGLNSDQLREIRLFTLTHPNSEAA
jgi:response regulator RpfG family c-di-GMP phosphodiesterase